MTRAAPPPAFLVTQWAVCGIVAAAARFVPVPLLDDMVRERAVQIAVSRTLLAHGRDYPSGRLSPLWGEQPGQAGRMRRRVRALPLRVLLFPVRKYAAVFGAVRGVPNDVMRVVLLARTVDRRLDLGDLADADADRLGGRAVEIRRAVEEAIAGMDLRLLTALLADSLSQGRGLTSAGSPTAAAGCSGRTTNRPLKQTGPSATALSGSPRSSDGGTSRNCWTGSIHTSTPH